jgi:hypothetical protein
LSHSAKHFFVIGFFKIESLELFALWLTLNLYPLDPFLLSS